MSDTNASSYRHASRTDPSSLVWISPPLHGYQPSNSVRVGDFSIIRSYTPQSARHLAVALSCQLSKASAITLLVQMPTDANESSFEHELDIYGALARHNMHSAIRNSVRLFVCRSVRPSVRRALPIITQWSLHAT